jgi:wyosine [tRNA(Phe)-imidazoG37] synthetase (radical SAM superfamily)
LAIASAPDYITLAGSGEPTLNARIGDLIGKIKSLTHIPVAVLSNGSLLWMREVREALMEADLVLPSLDAGDERLFRYVNRPHREITFERLVDGLAEFTERFSKSVWLEVFLLARVTGTPAEVEKIAALAKRIQPERIQLNTVSRPPAEEFAIAVSAGQMEQLKEFFPGTVEVISESARNASPTSFSPETTDADILALLGRRPCTVQGVSAGLGVHTSEVIKRLQVLIQQGAVIPVRKDDVMFYEVARAK